MVIPTVSDNIRGFPIEPIGLDIDDFPPLPPVGVWFKRSRKIMCRNCYLFHSTYETTELCYKCTINGKLITKWCKHQKNRRLLIKNILVINIVSKCLNTSELGLHKNIMKFLF